MDDELNILPTSSLIRFIEPVPLNADGTPENDPSAVSRAELSELIDSLSDTQPAGSLVSAVCVLVPACRCEAGAKKGENGEITKQWSLVEADLPPQGKSAGKQSCGAVSSPVTQSQLQSQGLCTVPRCPVTMLYQQRMSQPP